MVITPDVLHNVYFIYIQQEKELTFCKKEIVSNPNIVSVVANDNLKNLAKVINTSKVKWLTENLDKNNFPITLILLII